ncbi:hypothetical protein RB3734 [Rhodopirellula baltica SH 1]|uniref:Uncharacterized protein n=1 Tax=Rhodopirellula baltica (strain DSM 10527 / NCIMB 13988 / SH1) TaxID=243090 RepID=Q7UTQ9_RHOBA|nr:hypothetical protein RB3734 [Rhodopirellula baltica SH 1]
MSVENQRSWLDGANLGSPHGRSRRFSWVGAMGIGEVESSSKKLSILPAGFVLTR